MLDLLSLLPLQSPSSSPTKVSQHHAMISCFCVRYYWRVMDTEHRFSLPTRRLILNCLVPLLGSATMEQQRVPAKHQRLVQLLRPSFGLIGSEMILVSSMKSFLSTCSWTHRGQVPPLRIVVSDSDVLSLTYTSFTEYSSNIIVHSFLRQEVLLLEVRRLHGGRWRHFQYSYVVLS